MNYRLIKGQGCEIELNDPRIFSIHFIDDTVIVQRRDKQGNESMAKCPAMSIDY